MTEQKTSLITISKLATLHTVHQRGKIDPNKSREENQEYLNDLDQRLELFDLSSQSFTPETGDPAKETIGKSINYYRRLIILSTLNDDFQKKYKKEIQKAKTSNQLYEFIKELIPAQSPSQLQEKANTELNEMTRYIDENESFTRFLNRIKATAADASDEETVKTWLINSQFKKNLTSKIQQFLLDHDKNNSTAEEKAKFLDSKNKHLKTEKVNLLQTSDMAEMKEKIDTQNSALSELLECVGDLKMKFDSQLEVNAIKNTGNRDETRKTSSLSPSDIRQSWLYNKFGKPIRCGKCGMLGHYKKICPGTCKAICHLCQRQGHLQSACPTKSQTKN